MKSKVYRESSLGGEEGGKKNAVCMVRRERARGGRGGGVGGFGGGGPSALSENMPHALVELGGLAQASLKVTGESLCEEKHAAGAPRATGLPLLSLPPVLGPQLSVHSQAVINNTWHNNLRLIR